MTSTKTLALTAIMAASLLIPAAARAEDKMGHDMGEKPMMKMGETFQEADTNKDGSLDLKEFMTRHEAKFKEIDANSDGKLTQEEFQAHRETMKKKMGEYRAKMKEQHEGSGEQAPAEETNPE